MYTILLVDDDSGILKCIGDTLARSGYGVITASDGTAALEILRTASSVDLVITDYRMPGMDGLQLIRRIRETAGRLPVVMMTAYGDLESYLCAGDLAIARFLCKPVRPRKLIGTVLDIAAEEVCRRTG